MCVCVGRYRYLDVGIALEARGQLHEVVRFLEQGHFSGFWRFELRYPGLQSRHPHCHLLAGPRSGFLDVSVPVNYTVIL